MLFAWLFIIQFFRHVVNPSVKIVYQTIFEEGIMNVYHHDRNQSQHEKSTEKKQNSSKDGK
jgi:hypothetical protein